MSVACRLRVGDGFLMFDVNRFISGSFVMKRLPGWLAGACLAGMLAASGNAQNTPATVPAALPTDGSEVSASDTLRTLWTSMQSLEMEIQGLRTRIAASKSEDERKQLESSLEPLRARQNQLRSDFERVAAGTDMTAFEGPSDQPLDWQAEAQDLIKPFLRELRDATANTREIQSIRESIESLERKRRLAREAVSQIRTRETAAEDKGIKKALASEQEAWQRRLDETEGQLKAAQLHLRETESHSQSLVSLVSSLTSRFFRSRGLNLLLAILVFALFLFIARKGFTYLVRISPFHREGSRNFYVRLIDIAYYIFTGLGAFLAALIALYLAGDWLLLTLALVFLAGVLWTLKAAIPSFIEQMKLLLNLGPVREGERVFYRELPWKVGRIDIFTDLTNPQLEGGRLRLPLKELTSLLSRPAGPSENFFPCEKDDWVILSDGVYGKVVQQTPEVVQIVKLGGSRRHYRTADFLSLAPETLSRNFRLSTIFGIDYRHQSDSSQAIPETLREHLFLELVRLVGKDHLLALSVELAHAGESSLDLAVLADFSGSCAHRYQALTRALQRLCVEACNANHWDIPFNQITVHSPAAPPQT